MKERLIGAAVLVALGVWLIPWVLDGGPEAQSEVRSAALQLPAPDEPVPIRTQTLQLNPPRAAAAGSSSVAPARDAEPQREPAAAPAIPANTAADAARESDSERDSAGSAAADVEPAPERVASTPAPRPVTQAPATQMPAERPAPIQQAAATAPPPAPVPAVAHPAAGDWVVQLGAFSEEENARRLAQRVGTFGYKAEISTYRASGRSMYRVRVGPHETRARADAAASALAAHGLPAQVVAAD